MKKKIFWNIFTASVSAVVIFAVLAGILFYRDSERDTWDMLQTEAYYLAAGLVNTKEPEEFLRDIDGYSSRITLIAPDGSVLYDGQSGQGEMENHKDRPEVIQAMEQGAGRAVRFSSTLGEKNLYYALQLENGNILRLSNSVTALWRQLMRFIPALVLFVLLIAFAAAWMARKQTKAIIDPLNDINLGNPMNANTYEELSPFVRKIAKQNRKIRRQIKKLERKQDEFNSITDSLKEGLLLLNPKEMVLSINKSARHILGVGEEVALPQHLLYINRNPEISRAVKASLTGRQQEEVLKFNGRLYRVVASPAMFEGKVKGTVLLLLDETEKIQAENLRQEFTANVSHELKTPLTSISGYAEILKNGLVKPEDVQMFSARIYDEAERMIQLIEDIIRLSRLDEKNGLEEMTRVDLLELAKKTANSLEAKAAEHQVTLKVEGEPVKVEGVEAVLSEVLYNLLDNGIKYNRIGGEVKVVVRQQGKNAEIQVSDTGVGIPEEDVERVFERFYRVDKSHSRDSGGTGLGLSIVKRGVLFHNGEIQLSSQLGTGSIFTAHIPNQTSSRQEAQS